MSVRVNLLPREIEERRRARRISTYSVLGVVLVVALLGSLYALKLGEIADAEEAREQVRGEVARLEAQIAELEQYRVLAEELEARNHLLAEAMAGEVSVARVLNDLSLSFPSSSSMQTLTGSLSQEPEAPVGTDEAAIMSLSFTGYSMERYAPGVETVVAEFARVDGFFHSFLANAQHEDREGTDVTSFTGSVQMNEEARTDRYADGLPEGLPQ